jgi:hypothetical protein
VHEALADHRVIDRAVVLGDVEDLVQLLLEPTVTVGALPRAGQVQPATALPLESRPWL